MPLDTWIAIDFETATAARNSACALGLAVIEGTDVVEERSWLIQPPFNEYTYWNMRVHGITPDDTEDAPSFGELYEEVWPYLDGQRLIAHNASFDMSVLRGCVRSQRLDMPRLDYACSVSMARRAFPHLADHKLSTVCDHCGIALRHHDAASDARGAAMVALRCSEALGAASVTDAIGQLGVALRPL